MSSPVGSVPSQEWYLAISRGRSREGSCSWGALYRRLKRLGQLGWRSHLPDDATSLRIRRVQELTSLGAEVMFAAVDVADAEGMRAVFAEIRARFGSIHGVFHVGRELGSGGFRPLPNVDPSWLPNSTSPPSYVL